MEHSIRITVNEAELSAVLHYPHHETEPASCRNGKYPILIIAHGFIGSRVGVNRLFVKAARAFTRSGFMVLRFDYAGCGESVGEYGAGGIEQLIEQTRGVLDYACSIDCVDLSRVTLIGHSLGGAVALLTAAKDKRVKSLALWSAVAHPFNDIVNIVGKSFYEEVVKQGSADYLGYTFKPEFFESLMRHQPLEQVRLFNGDALVVHGTADTEVPVDYCFLYQKVFWLRSQGQCDKEVLFQADHTYSTAAAANGLFQATLHWLQQSEKRKNDWHDWTI